MAYDFDTARLATKPKSEIVVDMMAALHRLDALAREMERKWGACRLPALVPDDLAKRFYSQHRKVSMALREGRHQDALHEIERMVTAWRFLDQEADRLGAEPIHPAVWEVALRPRLQGQQALHPRCHHQDLRHIDRRQRGLCAWSSSRRAGRRITMGGRRDG